MKRGRREEKIIEKAKGKDEEVERVMENRREKKKKEEEMDGEIYKED